jgi:hypothetical protein
MNNIEKYLEKTGEEEIDFEKFILWAYEEKNIRVMIIKDDKYSLIIFGDGVKYKKDGFDYWFEAFDDCVDYVLNIENDFEYIKDVISFIKTLQKPETKEESVYMYQECVIQATENIKEILKGISEDDFINEKCNNRIEDAITLLMVAKNIL